MNDFESKALALLDSIDASLKTIAAISQKRAAANGPAVADDRDLDGKYGDEVLRFSPRDWHGESCKGKRMSECPPDLLDMLASSFDYFAKKNEGQLTDKGKPKSDFDRKSAARARGWAARLRAGWKRPAPPPMDETSNDFGDADDLTGTRGDAFEAVDDFGSGGF